MAAIGAALLSQDRSLQVIERFRSRISFQDEFIYDVEAKLHCKEIASGTGSPLEFVS